MAKCKEVKMDKHSGFPLTEKQREAAAARRREADATREILKKLDQTKKK